jgi:hypothetical protein
MHKLHVCMLEQRACAGISCTHAHIKTIYTHKHMRARTHTHTHTHTQTSYKFAWTLCACVWSYTQIHMRMQIMHARAHTHTHIHTGNLPIYSNLHGPFLLVFDLLESVLCPRVRDLRTVRIRTRFWRGKHSFRWRRGLCVYMNVYMLCIYVYMYICAYTHTYIYTCTYIHV